MSLSKSVVVVSFLAASVSFMLYIAPCDAILLSSNQINEVLLAIFGAGISSLGVGLIEYCHHKNKLENRLLITAEPLISAVAGLKQCNFERIGDGVNASSLLVAYFEEKESNELLGKSASPVFPASHVARNTLICAIEHCDEGKCDLYANNPGSSSSRYIARFEKNLLEVANTYRGCDRSFREMGPRFDDEIECFSYLFDCFSRIPVFSNCPSVRKRRCIKEIKESKAEIESKLEPVFGQVRLFDCNQSGYSELLACFLGVQKQWINLDVNAICGENAFARSLFELLSDFASATNSTVAKYYEKPWWV